MMAGMSKFSRKLRIVAASLLLVGSIAAVPGSATAQRGQPERSGPGLDRAALQRGLDAVPAAGAPGALATVRADRASWRGAAGLAELSNARPMRPNMRHRVGSITKTFVSATLLQLVQEGRIGLDDPVGRWLPELVPGEVGQRVTVRMLLNHTSGIGNYTDALLTSLTAVIELGTTTYSPAELVAIGLDLPRTGAPGAGFSYSNTNYILAGLLVERVTGNEVEAEVTRRILRPLRLADTYFPGADPRIRGPHGGAYFAPLGVRDFGEYGMTWAWAAGELVSTMEDLNTFFRALLGGRIVAGRTLDAMLTTVPMNPQVPQAGSYGLGIYSLGLPCGTVWGHDGAVIGHLTISLHSRDGTRQVSTGINLSHYQILVPGEAHPIDAAWWEFLAAAHCSAQSPQSPATARSAVPPSLPAITAAIRALR